MQNPPWAKAALMALVLVIIAIGSWEIYLRSINKQTSFDDGKELWTYQRSQVYGDPKTTTVFVGSSRIKYDLDQQTWTNLTGDTPIQLAIEGSSPVPALDNLAADPKFKGKLVVDVTEGLFFSNSNFANGQPRERIDYFKKVTPAQRFSFQINKFLESKLVFLDKESYSLNALLNETRIPNRPGVFEMPIFPREFGLVHFNRQDYMSDRFVLDSNETNTVKNIWVFFSKMPSPPPPTGASLDSIMNHIKDDVDKIKARGGQVLFVRTPSSGPYLQAEMGGFPRNVYWDKLLEVTKSPGIHFLDYPAIANFQCPEFSHLKPADATIFTRNFVDILEKEKGWTFPNKPALASK
jgi:hypothetical protein